jgi:hypothetical protein
MWNCSPLSRSVTEYLGTFDVFELSASYGTGTTGMSPAAADEGDTIGVVRADDAAADEAEGEGPEEGPDEADAAE